MFSYYEVAPERVSRTLRAEAEDAVALSSDKLGLPPVRIRWWKQEPVQWRFRKRAMVDYADWQQPDWWHGGDWPEDVESEMPIWRFYVNHVSWHDAKMHGWARSDEPDTINLVTSRDRERRLGGGPMQVWATAAHECRHLAQFRDEPLPESLKESPPMPVSDADVAHVAALPAEERQAYVAVMQAKVEQYRVACEQYLAEFEQFHAAASPRREAEAEAFESEMFDQYRCE
jgi:hypothetical protein